MFKIKILSFISTLVVFVNIEIAAVLPDWVALPFPPKYNFYQTKNDCGPYSVLAVTNFYGLNKRINEILDDFKDYRLKNNYSLPAGLENALVKSGLKIEVDMFYFRDNNFRIESIKSDLAAGRPVIILVGIKNYQHYLKGHL